jgi:hypothetical protein
LKSRNDIKEFVLSIENNLPVKEWKIENIDIWPLIRIRLFFDLIGHVDKTVNLSTKGAAQKKTPSNSLVSRIRNHRKVKKLNAKLYLNKLKKVDFLFGAAHTQRGIFNNTSYSKLTDPLMNERASVLIEHSLKEEYELSAIYKKKRVHFLYDMLDYSLYSEKRYQRLNSEYKYNLEKYDEFLQILKDKNISTTKYELNTLKKLVDRFFGFCDCYEEILARTNPKAVFTVCYYSFPAMALNFVANEMNIPTIELQHGPQSDLHLAYSNWINIPNNGFNTLPKTFWNWDSYSFDIINKWTSKSSFHDNIVGGNPWLEFLKKDVSANREIILYTLQNYKLEYHFPEYLIEIIKSNPSIKWWVRLHPRQFVTQNEVIDFLTKNGIYKIVNIEDATTLPLPEVLNKVKIHITNSSGCTLEAAQCGIPTILINEIGQQSFPNLIDEGRAFYAENSDDFTAIFEKLVSGEISIAPLENTISYKDVIKSLT